MSTYNVHWIKPPANLILRVAAWMITCIVSTQNTCAAPVDLSSYNPDCGVAVRLTGETLVMRWKTPEGFTELNLNTSGRGPLIRSISVAPDGKESTVVLRNADPVTVLSVGQRDLGKRQGWNIFFDRTSRKPSESGPLTLKLTAVEVQSLGRRCMVDLIGLEGQAFAGKLRFTLYAGCDLIHLQAIVQTQKDARALLYHAGMTCDPDGKSVSWIGLDDTMHRAAAKQRPAAPEKVRYRTIALETKTGSVAIFPPPHRYFYPLDEAFNLGFNWWGNDFMGKVPDFGIGIRQDLEGDRRWVPWFNAPPDTEQRLDIFWLPSTKHGNALFDHVKAYTHDDRFPELEGHKTFTSHYHIEHTTRLIEERNKNTANDLPKALERPDFIEVFKNAGIQIVHLAEFHNRLGRTRRDPIKALPLLQLLHEECQRLSDDGFLLLPGEEPNVHLGGHWISFFPRPVMWVLDRAKDKPFIEKHPQFGLVYHVGNPEDILKLMEREGGLMWAAHPRIKSSTGYPDLYRESHFFKSDRYLGGAWKAMPANLSKPRLGWRVLDLLDDTSNWGAKKYILGEVDIFQVDRTTEFYAHANVNYMRLARIPRFEEGWGTVLEALRGGAFFISTGEVLMPRFKVGGKLSGETLKLDASGQAKLDASLTWTFPMAFAEIISGDGKQVFRKRINLESTEAFGNQTLQTALDLSGKKWVRLEAWDVAANGVISQPVWLE